MVPDLFDLLQRCPHHLGDARNDPSVSHGAATDARVPVRPFVHETETVTAQGFVRASKTGERFCDWASSASISASVASASML